MNIKLLKLLLICCVIANLKAKPTRHQLFWTKLVCDDNPEYFKKLNCFISQPEQERFNVEAYLARDLTAAIGNISVNILRPNGKMLHLFTVEVDFCKFLIEPSKMRFVAALRHGFEKYGNLHTGCPIQKDIFFHLYNYTVDSNLIPHFTPEMRFASECSFYTPDRVVIAHIKLTGRLEENIRSRLKPLVRVKA